MSIVVYWVHQKSFSLNVYRLVMLLNTESLCVTNNMVEISKNYVGAWAGVPLFGGRKVFLENTFVSRKKD